MHIYSSIQPKLMKRSLFLGTGIAALGLLPICAAFLYLPPEKLSSWGLIAFCLGIGLIGIGMLPYRRLCRLERHPHKLTLKGEESLIYSIGDKHVLCIPLSLISRLRYCENGRNYGIGLDLKPNGPGCASLRGCSLEAARHLKSGSKQWGCTFFFPFFTRRAADTLNKHIRFPL